MARAYASRIIRAPVQAVWGIVRDFNGLPDWAVGIARSKIEGGLDPDVVGCIRSFYTKDGTHIRERLLAFSDAKYLMTYNFEKPAFPVKNYIATLRLYPVTHTDSTFAEWTATFDEAPGDEGKYEKIISKDVFAANFANLAKILTRSKPKPTLAPRWKGGAPNKVWTSRQIRAPLDKVWGVMRDFAGMGRWHSDMTQMHMLKRHRPDKVSGIRDFHAGAAGHLHEELLHLDDLNHSFSYRITKCDIPWLNYVSGPRLWPVTADNTTFGVWTGDWDASPQDDLRLISGTEANVYQRGFAGVEAVLKGRPLPKG